MTIKKGDFIELNYTGKIADSGQVFDTSVQKVAEDNGLLHKHEPGHDHDHSDQYSPVVICVGEKQLLPGLDEGIEGKDIGTHKVKVETEKAFGKKNSKLLKIMPMKIFKQQNIQPFVGLELNIDGQIGIVRNVTGGRTIVDFNHPLAGKDLEYEIEIKKIVTDKKAQVEAIFKLLGVKPKVFELKEGKATVELDMEIPEEYLNKMSSEIKRLTGVDVEFKTVKQSTTEEKKALVEETKEVKE